LTKAEEAVTVVFGTPMRRRKWTMTRYVWLLLLLGLAVGLAGCIVLSPDYPGYVPAYPAPAFGAPPPGAAPAPPPAGPRPAPVPSAQAPPPGSARNCQTVTVEGHYETRVAPSGQRATVWVPSYTQQMCQ